MARGKTGGKPNGKAKRGGRRSKAESSTGKKENAAEVRKAGELDLQPIAINDDDFDLHFRATKNAKERVETAQSLYRTCLKNAKKVSPDLHDSIKDALAFEGMDPHDIKRKLEINGYVLRKTGSSVQLTIWRATRARLTTSAALRMARRAGRPMLARLRAQTLRANICGAGGMAPRAISA